MEDYGSAFSSRRADVEALLGCQPPRSTAAAHIGGVAIECKLKSLVVNYHGIKYWGDNSTRAKDSRRGQPIERPGHGLLSSLRLMNQMFSKASLDPNFMRHLSRIMHPRGATENDFIELRYSGDEIAANTLAEWRVSLQYVIGWLEKNGGER